MRTFKEYEDKTIFVPDSSIMINGNSLIALNPYDEDNFYVIAFFMKSRLVDNKYTVIIQHLGESFFKTFTTEKDAINCLTNLTFEDIFEFDYYK